MPTKRSTHPEENNDILTAEFEYIASSAVQANEDRARVASFYLVAVGSLVAALFSTQIFSTEADRATISLLFSGLFLVLTLLGTLTVIQLARLRASWYESMLAMNQIKEYVIGKHKDLAKAFRWRNHTLPSLHKINSVSYQQTIEVALLSGLTFGASVHFLLAGIENNCAPCSWGFTIGGAVFGFFAQLFIYKRFLLTSHKG
jgi:hypothetical protein